MYINIQFAPFIHCCSSWTKVFFHIHHKTGIGLCIFIVIVFITMFKLRLCEKHVNVVGLGDLVGGGSRHEQLCPGTCSLLLNTHLHKNNI